MYKTYFTKKALKDLDRLTPKEFQRVSEKISAISLPFATSLDIKKLADIPDFYRLRVGELRIIFEIDQRLESIIIRKIASRGDVY